MDAATVSIPVSITALVGVAFAAGKIQQKVESIRELVAEMKRDAKESSKDQGQRLGDLEDELAVLRDFKVRTEGIELGRRRERADTRGVPAHVPSTGDSQE